MGCNCKKKHIGGNDVSITTKNNNNINRGLITNILLFIISTVLVPFLYPVIIIVLFKHFIIGGNVEFMTFLNKVKTKEISDITSEDKLYETDYDIIGVDEMEIVRHE